MPIKCHFLFDPKFIILFIVWNLSGGKERGKEMWRAHTHSIKHTKPHKIIIEWNEKSSKWYNEIIIIMIILPVCVRFGRCAKGGHMTPKIGWIRWTSLKMYVTLSNTRKIIRGPLSAPRLTHTLCPRIENDLTYVIDCMCPKIIIIIN